jgi:tryptophanyl-tRNA synthetase
MFVAAGVADQFDDDCRNARIGCVDRKKALAEALIEYLAPVTERLSYYREHQDEVRDVLLAGTNRAREEAGRVMGEVRRAMKINWY